MTQTVAALVAAAVDYERTLVLAIEVSNESALDQQDGVLGGHFITTFPNSVVDFYARRFGLKVLPVDLPRHPWPVVVLTLKHRTLSPVITAFIDCTRAVTKPLAKTSAT